LGGNNETKSEKGSCVMMWRLFINLMVVTGVHFVLFFLWYWDVKFDVYIMFLPNLIVNVFGLPYLLLKINYRLSLKYRQQDFIFNTLLIIILSLIGHGFSYFNWGITTGYLKKPDPATIGILKMEYIISLIVIIVGGYIYHKKLKNVFR
jgi:hypothetical protein